MDVAAAGVQELAILAVRHLDSHEPNVKHILKSVADVERQVQVSNLLFKNMNNIKLSQVFIQILISGCKWSQIHFNITNWL